MAVGPRVPLIVLALLSWPVFGCAGAQKPGDQLRESAALVRNDAAADRLEEMGVAAASTGDVTRAEQYFTAALRGGGDAKRLTERLMGVCVSDRRYPVALVYAEEYLERNPTDTDVRYAAAMIGWAIGDWKRAHESLERVVREKPEIAEAHYALAKILREDGSDYTRADEHFRTYLRLKPNGRHAEDAKAQLLKEVPVSK